MANSKPSVKYYVFITVVLLVAILAGYLIGIFNHSYTLEYVKSSIGYGGYVQDLSSFYAFLFIFLNNAIKAFFTILLGFLFGIFPIYFIASNGVLIGFVLAIVSAEVSPAEFIAGTLPHGIFEIPAIVIAATYGLWLGAKFYRRVFKGKRGEFWDASRFAFKQYFRLILPMLLIAALIEAYVTPKIMDLVAK